MQYNNSKTNHALVLGATDFFSFLIYCVSLKLSLSMMSQMLYVLIISFTKYYFQEFVHSAPPGQSLFRRVVTSSFPVVLMRKTLNFNYKFDAKFCKKIYWQIDFIFILQFPSSEILPVVLHLIIIQ